MKRPVFHSFEEIDNRLQILALEREICLETIKSDLALALTGTVRHGVAIAVKPALKALAFSWALKTIRRKLLKE
ncbi:hypothetical protein [Robiginitalea sp. SC105]|uniref:hypothetical protein n=1 Tax=Robiginitalea sp. SC105 TaxID=2762332 RepID=UPI001639F951|nr:hypothetical protein [Robiginitalea sp. SC105]MBC2839566.1 hypothetical protein [Robiginitalea sp. SC105]